MGFRKIVWGSLRTGFYDDLEDLAVKNSRRNTSRKQWRRAFKGIAISRVRCFALCDLEKAREPRRLRFTSSSIETTTIPTMEQIFKTKVVQVCQHDVDGRTSLHVLRDVVSFADHGWWGQQEGRQGKECFSIVVELSGNPALRNSGTPTISIVQMVLFNNIEF